MNIPVADEQPKPKKVESVENQAQAQVVAGDVKIESSSEVLSKPVDIGGQEISDRDNVQLEVKLEKAIKNKSKFGTFR